MKKEIVNRVAKSPLVTIDLEELYPSGNRVTFDIAPWLLEGIVLREKEFRIEVENHQWDIYTNKYVSIYCSTEAIIPAWAFMLITTKLAPHANTVVIGTQKELETVLFFELMSDLNIEEYKNKSVIIKGCAEKPIPPAAYGFLISKLQPVAKSILYGEACSSVPLYKRKK